MDVRYLKFETDPDNPEAFTTPEGIRLEIEQGADAVKAVDTKALLSKIIESYTAAAEAAAANLEKIGPLVQSDNMETESLKDLRETIAPILEDVKKAYQAIKAILDSDDFKAISAEVLGLDEWLKSFFQQTTPADIIILARELESWKPVIHYIPDAIRAYKEASGLFAITMQEIMGDYSREYLGTPILNQILRTAQQEANHSIAAREALSITARRPTNIDYPVDKVNREMWKLGETDTNGQYGMVDVFFKTSSPNRPEVNVYYNIDFSALDEIDPNHTIARKLTLYDKRVYEAIGALWKHGRATKDGLYITLQEIYQAMGKTGRASAAEREKIRTSLKKFTVPITLHNNEEIDAKYKYPAFNYTAALLPLEFIQLDQPIKVNGQTVDTAIQIFREPPLLTFAKGRKQFTTYPLEVLQAPLNQTEDHLAIENYLLERIGEGRRKSKSTSTKILLSTLFKETNMQGNTERIRKKRLRAKETITTYLDHYKQVGIIRDYTLTADVIQITFNSSNSNS